MALRRFGAILLAGVLLVAIAQSARAPVARADADPASDTLLIQNVFYPYMPPTPAADQRALSTALDEIHATGLDLKVAIIGSAIDLGGIPQLFGQVQRYAEFLDTEISFKGPQPLLVVMPDGLATQRAGSPAAVKGITIDPAARSAGLARAAIEAVQRIAAADGHPIRPVLVLASSSGTSPIVIAVPALVLVLVAGWLISRIARRRTAVRSHSPGGNS